MVAGAGPTGLTLACCLLANGVSVRVVDQATGPARTSRALGLQPRGAEVLDRTGALGELPGRSIGIARVVVHVNGRRMASLRVGQRTKLVTRSGLLVSQAEIEAELRRRLADLGGRVEGGAELVCADQDEHGVTADLADGDPVRGDWVVGCDGAHSRVRKAAGIGFPGVPLSESFLLADVRADLPLPHDTVSVWLRGEDMVAAFPLPGQDLWRLMAPAPQGTACDSAPDAVMRVLTRLLVEHSGLAAACVRGVASVMPRTSPGSSRWSAPAGHRPHCWTPTRPSAAQSPPKCSPPPAA